MEVKLFFILNGQKIDFIFLCKTIQIQTFFLHNKNFKFRFCTFNNK